MPYETYEKLVSEADEWTPPPQGQEFYNPLTQRRKSQDRHIADQRRLYVIDRLKEVESGAPNVLDPAPLRRQLASPVEPYAKPGYSAWDPDKEEIVQVPGQYLGEDSPIWKALTWMGSPTSAIANASRALANQADRAVSYVVGQEPVEQYPGAWDKAKKDVATFTSVLPAPDGWKTAITGKAADTRWQDLRDMRKVQDQGPFQVIDPRMAERRIQEVNYASDQSDMIDLYEGAGLPPYAAYPLGMVGNIVTDPFAGMFSVRSLVRQGKTPAAWREFLTDVGAGVAPEVLMQAPEAYRQASESDVTQQIRDLLPGRY
jgi:hypothetical protein